MPFQYDSGTKVFGVAKPSNLNDNQVFFFKDANDLTDFINGLELDVQAALSKDGTQIPLLSGTSTPTITTAIAENSAKIEALNTYLPVEVTGDRAITTADTQTALWFKGIGSLLTLTVNTGSLAIGKDLEVHVGDADGFEFVAGVGANLIGQITGSTTVSDTVGLRRLADASFGLIGEVYKVI